MRRRGMGAGFVLGADRAGGACRGRRDGVGSSHKTKQAPIKAAWIYRDRTTTRVDPVARRGRFYVQKQIASKIDDVQGDIPTGPQANQRSLASSAGQQDHLRPSYGYTRPRMCSRRKKYPKVYFEHATRNTRRRTSPLLRCA